MAFQSRELTLSGRGNAPQMASSMPVDIVKQENSFIEWFRSSTKPT